MEQGQPRNLNMLASINGASHSNKQTKQKQNKTKKPRARFETQVRLHEDELCQVVTHSEVGDRDATGVLLRHNRMTVVLLNV